MSIIGWMVLGLISGLIASKVVHKEGRGIIPDIILGIGGAIFGGLLFKEFAAESVDSLKSLQHAGGDYRRYLGPSGLSRDFRPPARRNLRLEACRSGALTAGGR